MIRRRRPKREVEFSFDSFLDVVANVVGIILRLIMVAWIASRGYKGNGDTPPPSPPPALAEPETPPEPTDERESLLALRRSEVEKEEEAARAAEGRRGPDAEALRRELAELERAGREALRRHRGASQEADKAKAAARAVLMSSDELRRRSVGLLAEIEALKKLPSLKRTLRYHTPVSAEVQIDEVMFECQSGRVTLIDTGTMLKAAEMRARQQLAEMRNAPELKGMTPAAGAFRMDYLYEKDLTGGGYRLSWSLVPVEEKRGEAEADALREGSAFRRVVDGLSEKQTVVTLWAYEDSFPIYRALRDHLQKRGFVVAGRPMPLGSGIGASRNGTASRGQ
jgi:hypothetical protein